MHNHTHVSDPHYQSVVLHVLNSASTIYQMSIASPVLAADFFERGHVNTQAYEVTVVMPTSRPGGRPEYEHFPPYAPGTPVPLPYAPLRQLYTQACPLALVLKWETLCCRLSSLHPLSLLCCYVRQPHIMGRYGRQIHASRGICISKGGRSCGGRLYRGGVEVRLC